MPDLVQIADQLKYVPDQALAHELQSPSGLAPAYLVLGELQRRQLMRAGGGGQGKAQGSVLQDTLRQLEAPRPVGPPPPPGMTPPSMGQPRAGLASMPGATPPQNAGMPMRPMQEGGLVDSSDDGSGDYLSEMRLRRQYDVGDLLPGMYADGGDVEEDDDDGAPIGYAGRSAPATYDPTPEEANLINTIEHRESGGNPYARSNKSTASGLAQFIDSTWRQAANETGVGTKYPSAYLAPTHEQRINELYWLRKHGPNATESWAASGPYPELAQAAPGPPGPQNAYQPSAPAAPATWQAPANIQFPEVPEEKLLAGEKATQKRLIDQAKDPDDRYNANRAAMEAQFGTFDDSKSRAGIQWLMQQAQENLHPSISNVLLRMGMSLLAAPAMTFGQAFGRAGLETMAALDNQKQEARQEWVAALKLGVELDDKHRQYNYQIAQLAQAKTSTDEQHWQTMLSHTDSQINTLQEKLSSNKQYQQNQRGLQWNQMNPDRQLTSQFDPNFQKLSPEEQHLYLGENLPTPAKPTQPTFQMQTAEDRAQILARKIGLNPPAGQAMNVLRAAGHFDLAAQAAQDPAVEEARLQRVEQGKQKASETGPEAIRIEADLVNSDVNAWDDLKPDHKALVAQDLKARGLPVPVRKGNKTLDDQAAASQTALLHVANARKMLADPFIQQRVLGPVEGRLQKGLQTTGLPLPGATPDQTRKAQDFLTSLNYLFFREGRPLFGGRPPEQLMQELAKTSPGVQMTPARFAGALDAVERTENMAIQSARDWRYGANVPAAQTAGAPAAYKVGQKVRSKSTGKTGTVTAVGQDGKPTAVNWQ